MVTAFLNDLENSRGVSARTRNLRLTAIRSFFRFASYELPNRSAQIQRVLAMPRKRYTRRLINFLTREEVVALLGAPDKRTWTGRRDHALMMLAVQTGLRLTEVTGLTRQSFTLGKASYLQVIGKGRKERAVPLCKPVVAVLKAWLDEPRMDGTDVVFPSTRGSRLSARCGTASFEQTPVERVEGMPLDSEEEDYFPLPEAHDGHGSASCRRGTNSHRSLARS
jgi:site-specific recombinase XerD